MQYTEVNSKIGFWLRRLCSQFFCLHLAVFSNKAARSRTKNCRSLLAKLPTFEFTSVYLLTIFLAALMYLSTNAYCTQANSPALFYWDARPLLGFSNFGDALSEALVERMLGRPVRIASQPFNGEKKLLGMGSILNYAGDGDVVWGSGVNGKSPEQAHKFTSLDVRAVRGPLTRDFLLKKGISCPQVYGDPTLLLPVFFPEFQKPKAPEYDYIIVPHFSDEYLFRDLPNMVSAKEPWNVVVEKILNSKFVIASALSGVIVAEAFGVPARLLQVENNLNTETLFKYKDYYYGTNRYNFQYATSLEQALEMGGEALPECDLERLAQSFPYELFTN